MLLSVSPLFYNCYFNPAYLWIVIELPLNKYDLHDVRVHEIILSKNMRGGRVETFKKKKFTAAPN